MKPSPERGESLSVRAGTILEGVHCDDGESFVTSYKNS